MRCGLLIGVLVATPALATGEMREPPAPLPLIAAEYDLPERDAADADRFLLPDLTERYETRRPPRLRWRGKKVKLRLPIG